MIQKKTLWFVLTFIIPILSLSQEYKFKSYGQHEGLTDVFVNTINQDENGYLVVGTGQGVGFYDGTKFEMKDKNDNLVDNFISTSFKDSKGNIWFGHNQGGITKYNNKDFELIHPGDGINSVIKSIQEDSEGNMWVATQAFGVFRRAEDKQITFFNEKFENRMISSMFIDENDLLFIGVDNTLEIYRVLKKENEIHLSKIQSLSTIEDEVVKILELDNGKKVVATKTLGLFTLEQKESIYTVTPINISNYSEELFIQDIYINSGILWISTFGQGVLRTILTNNICFVSQNYNSENGLGGENYISVTYVDREGVLWIGTAGAGLYSKEDDFFTFYFRDKIKENNVTYLKVTSTEIWTSGKGILQKYNKQYAKLLKTYSSDSNAIPKDRITCFYVLSDTTILIGTKESGFYYKLPNEELFKKFELSDDVLSSSITSIAGNDKYIWVGTQNGMYKIDVATQKSERYSMSDGLSHNVVKNIYIGKNNKIYVGTSSAFLNIIENDEIIKLPFRIGDSEDYVSVKVTKIFEDDKGNIWVSSQGQGVFCFRDTTIDHFGVEEGLFNNYCYGVAMDDKNTIWVSHDGGLSSINLSTMEVEIFDSKYGLETRFSVSAIDTYKNEVWFGTQNGVVKYDSKEAVKNNVPPITSLKYMVINDNKLEPKDTILPSSEYNIEFVFKGVSLKNTEGVKYKYILEGYNEDWSDFTTLGKIKYTKVRDGEYVFKVKSYNSDGVEGNTASVKIAIKKPIYKQAWFYVVLFVLFLVVVGAIIKYRERQQLNYLKHLSEELDKRTAELVEQKEKMEEINKDLTDSINYAQRIQRAILPEDERVKELFPESFIIFKPRDIVSGDFYWIAEYFGKKIIVFADCTGHGVPGGFMSMIGRILLRETCTVKNLRDPGVILDEIDQGLVNVLRQKDDIESNKDGMDLGVCIIDSRTNILSYAGAMRPLYIYRNGVRHVLKGSRYSVGGISSVKKVFESKTFKLESGDILYMFSDGFPDQFGGRRGRKMKISVLNELLDQVCLMPFDQQKHEIETFFETWKRDEPQMDDVLMIGIKIE